MAGEIGPFGAGIVLTFPAKRGILALTMEDWRLCTMEDDAMYVDYYPLCNPWVDLFYLPCFASFYDNPTASIWFVPGTFDDYGVQHDWVARLW